MKSPDDVSAEIAMLPAPLRALVEAELEAGNEVAELLHGFPGVPAGAGVRLARPISLSARPISPASAGVRLCRFPGWDGSVGFSDEAGHSFVLGPRAAPPEPSTPDAVREAAGPNSPLARFERSFYIDVETWRDGTGYDLEAIRDASPEERASIEALLLRRGARDWRDVEALAVLDSPPTREALRSASESRRHEVALAVVRHAPELLTEPQREAIVVRALEEATFYGGLTQALSRAEEHPSAAVIEVLLRGAAKRDGEVAPAFAALLMFLHGQAETAFDMEQRPFFLEFGTQDPTAREVVFRELCRRIGVDARRFLEPG